jgi:hypothetical protein
MDGKAAVDLGGEVGHAFPGGGPGLDHRRLPDAFGMQALRQGDHLGQHLHRTVGFLVVGLVHHEDVADLVDAGLGRLHVVAAHRRLQQHHHGGVTHDVGFILADADGFDQHDVPGHGIEHGERIAGGAREPAKVPARGHAADEDAADRRCGPSCAGGRRARRRPRRGSTDRPPAPPP